MSWKHLYFFLREIILFKEEYDLWCLMLTLVTNNHINFTIKHIFKIKFEMIFLIKEKKKRLLIEERVR